MRLNANVKRRFETEHRILDKLYGLMPVGEEVVGISYPQVAEKSGEQVHAVLGAKRSFEEAGILRTRIDYPKGKSGRVGVWMLTMSRELAHEELKKEHNRQLGQPSHKAARRDATMMAGGVPISRLVASLGPDSTPQPFEPLRALRKDDALALIEAARQYRHRADSIAETVEKLKAEGIEVKDGAFELQRDSRLEAIALVLPAIDQFSRTAERATEQAEIWSQRIGEVQSDRDAWKKKAEGLERIVERMTRESVVTTQGHV